MKAEITANPGHLPALLDVLNTSLFPIMEQNGGWRLHGCFVQTTGRLNSITDLWELDDYQHFATGNAALRAHPDYPEIRVLLDRHIESETLVFMEARGGRLFQLEN